MHAHHGKKNDSIPLFTTNKPSTPMMNNKNSKKDNHHNPKLRQDAINKKIELKKRQGGKSKSSSESPKSNRKIMQSMVDKKMPFMRQVPSAQQIMGNIAYPITPIVTNPNMVIPSTLSGVASMIPHTVIPHSVINDIKLPVSAMSITDIPTSVSDSFNVESLPDGIKVTYNGKEYIIHNGANGDDGTDGKNGIDGKDVEATILSNEVKASIEGLSKTSGVKGEHVIIYGQGFDRGSFVLWGDTTITDPYVISSNQIKLVVPTSVAKITQVRVQLPNWKVTNSIEFEYYK